MEVRRHDGGVIAVEVVGEPSARPVLVCHGLAETRLAVHRSAGAAVQHGLRLIAPDRPGVGETDRRRLNQVTDWVTEAAEVLEALDVGQVQVLGVSGGGAFAAACAARLGRRVDRLVLVAPLGPPHWPVDGMERWQRWSLRLGVHAPWFGGWWLGRMGAWARRHPEAYFRVITRHLTEADRQALSEPETRQDFLRNYLAAFAHGAAGVAQDLRLLTRPWGFEVGEIEVPTIIHQGSADTVVPPEHARRYAAAIPNARLVIHPGHGHFSIPARWDWETTVG